MVLTDREIELALRHKQIFIDPTPSEDKISSTAVDLHLGKDIRVWKDEKTPGVDYVVCPATPGYKFNDFIKSATNSVAMGSSGHTIAPGSFFLAWTAERVKLPFESRLAARVEGKSSLARLGVGVHVTAPTIHAGFEGAIQLEVWNHGVWPVRLLPGMPICQLIFEQTTGTPNAGYKGQFQNQASTT